MHKLIVSAPVDKVKVTHQTNTIEFNRGEDKFSLRILFDDQQEGLQLTHDLTGDTYYVQVNRSNFSSSLGLKMVMDRDQLTKFIVESAQRKNLLLEYVSYTELKLKFSKGSKSVEQFLTRQSKDTAVCKKDLAKRLDKIDRQLRALSKEDLSFDFLESLDEIKEKMTERLKLYDDISKSKIDCPCGRSKK